MLRDVLHYRFQKISRGDTFAILQEQPTEVARSAEQIQSRSLLPGCRYSLGENGPSLVAAILEQQQTSPQSMKLGKRKYLSVFSRCPEAGEEGFLGNSDLARSQSSVRQKRAPGGHVDTCACVDPVRYPLVCLNHPIGPAEKMGEGDAMVNLRRRQPKTKTLILAVVDLLPR